MPLIFAYGSLQQEDVQRSTFRRLLHGQRDALLGFEPSTVGPYTNVTFNGRDDSRVEGTVFEITDAELLAADRYEQEAAYKRISVTLASGAQAWVYAHVGSDDVPLHGTHVRLEPLDYRHVDGLAAASANEPSLYRWSPVPKGKSEATTYVEMALAWKAAGTALPFATVRITDGVVIGSTRFFSLERWAWPPGHPSHGRAVPDACEIGYTWLTPAAVRTAANTEAKLLMLTHAFEAWKVLRVCLHADARNERSRAAIERLGATFEGILRSHRMAVDHIARDSARYSILASEWPAVKARLTGMLERR
jgi:RimJ/RimL family protein N-acetyltransferase